jgi:hypothetical protein
MYSAKVVQKNLDNFFLHEGWMPVYHSIRDVEQFISYVDSVTVAQSNTKSTYRDLKAGIKRGRAQEIARWVENEQVLCCLDANYFLTRYAYICDNKGEIHRYDPRLAQKVFISCLDQFDEAGTAMELLVLKARQQGISTVVALLFLHRLLFIPHTNAVMASVESSKSELLSRMMETCLERLPWWLIPAKTTDRISKQGFSNGSILSIQSGSQGTGIAQGWTPTLVHISEIGDIPNPQKVIEEGLLRATHPTRKLFQVYEGTGNGNVGWLAEKWRAAKESWPLGQSRLCPIFIPWACAPDQYPEADWLKKFPVPAGFSPIEMTRKHVRRAEHYIQVTPYLAKVCGSNWTMPIEQQWYWEFHWREAVSTHTEKIWLSQMPADDYEALQGKNDTVFSVETIQRISNTRNLEFQDYAIVGDTIDDGLEPNDDEIDYDEERISVHWESHRGQTYNWTMIPLVPYDDDKETDDKRTLGRVRVFEPPRAGYDYCIGIDTADGLGAEHEDRSVLSCTRSATGENADEQVAEFVSHRVNAPQMVGFAACIAAWYGERTKDTRGVKFAIEQRERPGDDCQLQLKLMGFTHHHIATRYDDKVVNPSKGSKQGWYTNSWSRPLLMNRFVDAVNNGWYVPHSKWLIWELASMERKTMVNGKTRMEHQKGKHDDRVFAAAMSYFTYHALDVMADRSKKRYLPEEDSRPDLIYRRNEFAQLSVGA